MVAGTSWVGRCLSSLWRHDVDGGTTAVLAARIGGRLTAVLAAGG
jgi:hypothetical protein